MLDRPVAGEPVFVIRTMRHGTTRDSGAPDHRYRVPELPKCYAGETDPMQRLFAFAYVQAQKARGEAEEERQRDAECLSAVITAQQRIAGGHLNLEQCLEFIVEQARCITGADGAAVALPDGGDFICRGRCGAIGPDLGARVDPQSGISGECLRTGETQQCDNTETDSRVELSVCRNQGIRSILAVPVQRQEVLGILAVFSGRAGVFSEREVRTLRLLAGLVVAQVTQHAGDVAAVAATQPARPTTEAQHVGQPARPAALALREAPGRQGQRSRKVLLLSLVVLAAASEAVVWRGLHIQRFVGVAKGFFAAPTPGAMPIPSSPATLPPASAKRRADIIVEAVPKKIPSPASIPDPTQGRSPKTAPREGSPPAPTRTPPNESHEASVMANPPSARLEGPVNLHSLFAGLEKIVQPEPISSEASIRPPASRDVSKAHENGQSVLSKHKRARSRAQLEHILEFRGVLKDRYINVRRVVGVRFAVYAQPQGGAPLWQELQDVEVDRFGHFTAQVGSKSPGGFPLFAMEGALWLGWSALEPGEMERRVWLVSAPSGFMSEGSVGRMVARNPVDQPTPEDEQASGSATRSSTGAAKPRHVE